MSTGSVYHHFRDKEALLNTLLEQFWAAIEAPDYPINKALDSGAFPDRLEEIGGAARDVVDTWRQHIALIYVDVVEFEGLHIRKFYSSFAARCDKFIAEHRDSRVIVDRLRPGVPPGVALLMALRIYFYYFVVDKLFGVPDAYGMDSAQAVAVMSDILKNGMLAPQLRTVP